MATDDTEQLELARDLHDRGLIKDALYRVWCMHRYGYTFQQIADLMLAQQIRALEARQPSYNENLGKVTDKEHDEEAVRGHPVSTLQYWYKKAQRIVDKEQDRIREGMPRLGVTGEIGGEVEFLFDTVLAKTLRKTG